MELRRLTDSGIEEFRGYLSRLRQGAVEPPPVRLLTDPGSSRPFRGGGAVEERFFGSRLDFARYIDGVLDGVSGAAEGLEEDARLWSWLSLFYFDQVCPPNERGPRRPGMDYRHIPQPGYRTGHRHLLSGAYLVYTVHGWGEALSRLPLHTKLSVESYFHHEIATRQNFITNRGIMEALHILYYDQTQGRPKRGPVRSKRAAGSLYRFVDVLQQFDLTYDLYSMSGADIVNLLPAEFARWKKGR
jgi:hypothetical protein